MNNWFDISVLVLLLIVFVKGYQKGLIRMAIEFAIVICSTIFGGILAARILPIIESISNFSPQWTNVISYIISFIAIAFVLSLIGKIVQKIFHAINLNFVNRIGGGIISMGVSMVILSIVLNLILVLDKNQTLIKPEIAKSSFFYEGIQAVVPAATPYLKFDILDDIIPDDYINQIESFNKGIIDSSYQKRYFDTDSL